MKKRWYQWTFAIVALLIIASGSAYAWMKYLLETTDPFAVVNHPWQPAMLHVHVLAAPVFLILCGIVFTSHMEARLTQKVRNRVSGFVSLVTLLTMVATGYLLQVMTTSSAVTWCVVLHLASGLGFTLAYLTHLATGLRLWVRIRRLAQGPVSASRIMPVVFVLSTSVWLLGAQAVKSLVAREVYLMGTQATLSTWDADRGRGLARLEVLLRALEAADAQLSTWRTTSEISRLNAGAGSGRMTVSASLCNVFPDLDRWSRETGGTFDPAVGALTAVWDLHGAGRVPSTADLELAMRRSGWAQIAFDETECTIDLPTGLAIDVGGFGKGAALDRALAALGADSTPWLIDLGGQVAANAARPGQLGWDVMLAHPHHRTTPMFSVRLTSGSLATSGGSERDRSVGGRRVGHILDPRTGHPATFTGSVVVWHPQALAADVLSTALYVMGPDAGIAWADARRIAALYLVSSWDGSPHPRASRSFAARFSLVPVH